MLFGITLDIFLFISLGRTACQRVYYCAGNIGNKTLIKDYNFLTTLNIKLMISSVLTRSHKGGNIDRGN